MCVVSKEWRSKKYVGATLGRVRSDLIARLPVTCYDQKRALSDDLSFSKARASPDLVSCDTVKYVYEYLVGLPPAWAVCGMSEYSYEHFSRCVRFVLERQASDKALKALYARVKQGSGSDRLSLMPYDKGIGEDLEMQARFGLKSNFLEAVSFCRGRNVVYPDFAQAYQHMTSGGREKSSGLGSHEEDLAIRRKVNCPDILKLAAELEGQPPKVDAQPASPPSPGELAKLMMRGYDRCLGRNRDHPVSQAHCACVARVLGEAKITEAEWHAYADEGHEPRRALDFRRCRQSIDQIAEVLERFTRPIQCDPNSPGGGPEGWQIQAAANEFILADCNNMGQLLKLAAGKRAVDLALLSIVRLKRKGDFCTMSTIGSTLSFQVRGFRREACESGGANVQRCRGEIILGCTLAGDPVRDTLICSPVRLPFRLQLDLAFIPASCGWQVKAVKQ